MINYGRTIVQSKGFVELYKDGKFQKLKYFCDRYQRKIVMDAMRKEVKNLYGDFSFIIKLDEL